MIAQRAGGPLQGQLWGAEERQESASDGAAQLAVPDSLLRVLRQNASVLNELAIRYGAGPGVAGSTSTLPTTVGTPGDIAALVGAEMEQLVQEQLRVVLLNTKNRVVGQEVIYKGMVNSIDLRVAEVLRPAVVAGTPAFIVLHNHPSGDPTPSPEDMVCTRRLVDAAKLLDVAMLDHVVVCGPGNWVSMRERGLVAFNNDSMAAASRWHRMDGYEARRS